MMSLTTLNHQPWPPPLTSSTCELPADSLGAFLEGRSSTQDARDIEGHLVRCSRCRWICATSAQLLRSAAFSSEDPGL